MRSNNFFSKIFLLIFFSVTFVGCSLQRYLTDPDSNVYILADYDEAIHHWVEHDEVHDKLIGLADCHSLFLTWEVRQAYLSTLKEKVTPEDDEFNRERDRQIKQFENGNEFLIGLYCYDKDWYQLTGSDPIWRLSMTTDTGIVIKPSLIEESPISTDLRWSYLDFMSEGRKTYRVVFPKFTKDGTKILDSNTRWFRLSCNSLLGKLEMTWELGPIPLKRQ